MKISQLVRILAILLIASNLPAHAGYAYPKPPANWSLVPIEGAILKSERSAVRDSLNNNVFTAVADVYLPGAGNIKYPVSFKEASNAANYVAKRTFIIPALSVAVLTVMAEWLSSAGLQTWIDPATGVQVWATPTLPNIDFQPWYNTTSLVSPSLQSATRTIPELCILLSKNPPYYNNPPATFVSYSFQAGSNDRFVNCQFSNPAKTIPIQRCIGNTYWNGAGCVVAPLMRPVSQPEFETIVSPKRIPVELPPILPFGLPVEDPITNPKPFPFGDPEPFFVPTGDPVPAPNPRPNPDPYPYTEPGVRVKPSPKPLPDPDPWRVDIQPVNKPKPDTVPTPNINPTPLPDTTPEPLPDPTGSGTPTPEKDPGLCALFPDILACAKLGDAPESPELQDKSVDVQITSTGGFGADTGTCPPDKMISLSFINRSVPITYKHVCSLSTGIRPIVLALAWLSAALIVVGMGRKS